MNGIREDEIRQRAYDIWEREGRQEGLDESHWHRAAQELAAERGERSEAGKGKPAASGIASNLHPGGTLPAGGQASLGSVGTGGGSTGGSGTGSVGHKQ